MTVFAGVQQAVTYPSIGMVGDQYGLQSTWLPCLGFLAASDITIATGVFGVPGTDTVQQSSSGGAVFAGFVPRSQANVIPYADTQQGHSMLVKSGYQLEVLPKGSLMMKITTSYNVGSVINRGDAVFVNTTDGTLAVGVTSQTPFIQTDWIITNTGQSNLSTTNQVVISNMFPFLGQ